MRDKTVSDEELDDLLLYPFPDGALFPHTVLPLKVRDPELLPVVENCIAEGLPLAVWQVAAAEGGIDEGRPRSDVATVGRVAIHHTMPGGGLDIVVEGLERVRVLEELPSLEGSRRVRAARHPLDFVGPDEVEHRLRTLQAMSFLLTGRHPRAAKLVRVTLGRLSCWGELSDVLCSVSFDDARLRQVLLQQSSVGRRLDRVIDSLARLLLSGADFDRPFELQSEFE